MTRKEEIINAARTYNDSVTLASPSNVIHFEAGAKWADEHPNLDSLWHEPSEEPKEYPIICQDKFGNVWVQHSLKDYADGWEEFKEIESVASWVYYYRKEANYEIQINRRNFRI